MYYCNERSIGLLDSRSFMHENNVCSSRNQYCSLKKPNATSSFSKQKQSLLLVVSPSSCDGSILWVNRCHAFLPYCCVVPPSDGQISKTASLMALMSSRAIADPFLPVTLLPTRSRSRNSIPVRRLETSRWQGAILSTWDFASSVSLIRLSTVTRVPMLYVCVCVTVGAVCVKFSFHLCRSHSSASILSSRASCGCRALRRRVRFLY